MKYQITLNARVGLTVLHCPFGIFIIFMFDFVPHFSTLIEERMLCCIIL